MREGKQRRQSIHHAHLGRSGETFEIAQELFPQCRKIPRHVRIKAPGICPGVNDSTKVRESKELVHTGPDRIRHVGDLFCRGPVTKLYKKVIKIPRDTDGYMQVLSDVRFIKKPFRARYDWVFYALNHSCVTPLRFCSRGGMKKRAIHSNGPARLKLKEEFPNVFRMLQPNSTACASTTQPVLYPATTMCRAQGLAQQDSQGADRGSKTPGDR